MSNLIVNDISYSFGFLIGLASLATANSELLAVAKLSKPFLKTPAREAVIKVRLDF